MPFTLRMEARVSGVIPEGLSSQPELREDLSPVWQAWWQLHRDRRRDMGEALPITGVEMDSALDDARLTDGETRADWKALWREMDAVYFRWMAQRREAKERRNASDSNALS